MKILLWWSLFGGMHLVGSAVPVRTYFLKTTGMWGFKGLYSLVACTTFIPLCYVYFTNKHAGRLIFDPNVLLDYLAGSLMLLSIVIIVQGLTTPNPMTTQSEMTGRYLTRPRGIQRVTRHPGNLAFVLFGTAHCLSNPFVGDWLFFGGFAVFGVFSAIHQDRRTLATGPEAVKRFQAATSLLPFGAILAGKQHLALREFNPVGLTVSLILFLTLRLFHSVLFGGFGI